MNPNARVRPIGSNNVMSARQAMALMKSADEVDRVWREPGTMWSVGQVVGGWRVTRVRQCGPHISVMVEAEPSGMGTISNGRLFKTGSSLTVGKLICAAYDLADELRELIAAHRHAVNGGGGR